MHLTEQELDSIRTFFSTKPVLKAWLFGSYARGEASAESDVDLLVEVDYTGLDVFDYLGWAGQLAHVLGKPVDLGSAKHILRFYRPFIEADQILLYEGAHRRQAAA